MDKINLKKSNDTNKENTEKSIEKKLRKDSVWKTFVEHLSYLWICYISDFIVNFF